MGCLSKNRLRCLLRNTADLTRATIRDQVFKRSRCLDHLRYSVSFLLKLVTLSFNLSKVLPVLMG